MNKAVKHPEHYNEHPSIECIDVAEIFNFNLGNTVKYVWRARFKGKRLEDLKKAQWYLNREIENMEATTKLKWQRVQDEQDKEKTTSELSQTSQGQKAGLDPRSEIRCNTP